MNTKGKSRAKKLLNELQEFAGRFPHLSSVELQNSISQARTELQAQFNTAIEWFVPSATGNSSPYFIQEAMMVAETIIKDANPSFKISIVDSEESKVSIHGHLPIFVDIFINVFENVVKRSGLEIPEAQVAIWTKDLAENSGIIYFKITNKLNADINLFQRSEELKNKMHLLQKESYSSFLAVEKNSGLFKIHKSVMDLKTLGLNVDPTMDFGITEGLFQITISIPYKSFVFDEISKTN